MPPSHKVVSKVESLENHANSWNLNFDYSIYLDELCSPQGVDDVETPKNSIYTQQCYLVAQLIMGISGGIHHDGSSFLYNRVMNPQTS